MYWDNICDGTFSKHRKVAKSKLQFIYIQLFLTIVSGKQVLFFSPQECQILALAKKAGYFCYYTHTIHVWYIHLHLVGFLW